MLEVEYRQIREAIDRDEKEAMFAIDKEQEKGQSKLVSLMKKFNENIEKMNRTKSEINTLLDQSQSITFLKVINSMILNENLSALYLYLYLRYTFAIKMIQSLQISFIGKNVQTFSCL